MLDFNLFPVDNNGVRHFGWAGPTEAKDAWAKVKNNFDPFKLEGKAKKKSKTKTSGNASALRKRFIWEVVRKVAGKDLLNYPQQAGSCVSEAARSCCNYLAATQILLEKKAEGFKESYAPYHYSTMRTLVAPKHGTRFGCSEDGGIGSYMAESFSEYGNLFADIPGLEEYTGQASIARKWGCYQPKKEFILEGQKHLVKKVARITSWEDYVDAISNGYPIHFCSMLSWNMKPDSNGFHSQSREGWAHALAHISVDDEYKDPYCEILNSWGDCHGQLKNFYTQEALPVGIIRSKKSVIARELERDDVEAFALSDMDGFYERKSEIDKALFDLFGT